MKHSILTTILFLISITLSAQYERIKELVNEGISLHDQEKYDEAIAKYKQALDIDRKSTLANYEIGYSYFATGQYNKAIKHANIVLKQGGSNQLESIILLGNSLDLTGRPSKAIQVYEKGLKDFPESNLLNYNFALTCFNEGYIDKAEKACIRAIESKLNHGSSHILLSTIMRSKGERVKSILPLYYFLMLEPDSKRSQVNYNNLLQQLSQGIEKKSDKNISVQIPRSTGSSKEFGAVEMMISLAAVKGYTEDDKHKSKMELFVEMNDKIFRILGELKKDNKGIWWDLYVSKLYDLILTNNNEAFSYYISQSTHDESVINWISENRHKMQSLMEWIKK